MDLIHDAQMDYYGSRLATCSSDKSVKIFQLSGETQTLVAELKGHEGPVWRVAWAPPKHGVMLATCGYDRRVIVWRETSKNAFAQVFSHTCGASVNAVAFAPAEVGLTLAAASSDRSVVVISYRDGQWAARAHAAHDQGVLAVAWAPPAAPLAAAAQAPRLASGGCDGAVKVWRLAAQGALELERTYEAHTDWVRDVAWSNGLERGAAVLASAGQDKAVHIFHADAQDDGPAASLPPFDDVVWRVQWSIAGNILAVASGNNHVSLWKESLDQDVQGSLYVRIN